MPSDLPDFVINFRPSVHVQRSGDISATGATVLAAKLGWVKSTSNRNHKSARRAFVNGGPIEHHAIVSVPRGPDCGKCISNISHSHRSTAPTSASSSGISRGSIIAIALVAAFCVFILVGALAYLILRRRRRAVAIERRRLAEESFRPRMRSLVLPSEQSAVEDRYPWMRPISVANAPSAAASAQQENIPYDPYVQRRPIVGRPTKLAPPTGESDDEVVDIVPRTREELDSLRPRPSNELAPSSFGTPVSPSFARTRGERQLDSVVIGSAPSVYDS